jgi:hypothetical protein
MTDKPAKPDAEKLLPREPSEAMIEAGILQVEECTDNWSASAACAAAHAWQAMWDAARPLPTSLQPQEQPEQDQGALPPQVYPDSEGGLVREFLGFAEFIRDNPPMQQRSISVRMIRAVADALRSPTSITDRDGVERVAKAIFYATNEWTQSHDNWDALPVYGRDVFEDRARAAIAALGDGVEAENKRLIEERIRLQAAKERIQRCRDELTFAVEQIVDVQIVLADISPTQDTTEREAT